MPTEYTAKQMRNKVRSKKHNYENMVRNKFFMPSFKATCVTNSWMEGVREGKFWVPKMHEVMTDSLAQPPRKKFLMIAIDQVLSHRGQSLGMHEDDVDSVGLDWLTRVLKTVWPDHRYFAKDYVPQGEERKDWMTRVEQIYVDHNDFYEGLPNPDDDERKHMRSRRVHRTHTYEVRGGTAPETCEDVETLQRKIDRQNAREHRRKQRQLRQDQEQREADRRRRRRERAMNRTRA